MMVTVIQKTDGKVSDTYKCSGCVTSLTRC